MLANYCRSLEITSQSQSPRISPRCVRRRAALSKTAPARRLSRLLGKLTGLRLLRMVHLALSACAAACATACVLPRLPACAILSTLLACLGVLAYIEPHADRRRRQQAAVVARLLFAAAEETEHALVVSAAELHRAQHASREHARELQVARRAAKSLVELERRQVALVAAAERDGFHASGWATRAAESEESACWASRATCLWWHMP